jgi:hypothetical protein
MFTTDYGEIPSLPVCGNLGLGAISSNLPILLPATAGKLLQVCSRFRCCGNGFLYALRKCPVRKSLLLHSVTYRVHLLRHIPCPSLLCSIWDPRFTFLAEDSELVGSIEGMSLSFPSSYKPARTMRPSGPLNGSTDVESHGDEELVKTLNNPIKISRIQSRISECSQELRNLLIVCRTNLCHSHAPTRRPARSADQRGL